MPKNIEDEKSAHIVLVGTENRELIILDKNGMSIIKTIKLEGIPVYMVTTGTYEVDYKVFIACRNGFTYLVKNGKISTSFDVHIESRPLGLVKLEKTIVMGAMNKNIYSFYNKGRLNFTK